MGSESKFSHFIMICNNYASSKGYKSESKFTSSQPSKTAVFLGTKTEVQSDGTLSTDLFCKSMACICSMILPSITCVYIFSEIRVHENKTDLYLHEEL